MANPPARAIIRSVRSSVGVTAPEADGADLQDVAAVGQEARSRVTLTQEVLRGEDRLKIASILVWSEKGEPRHDEVVLSDEPEDMPTKRLVVLDPDGRRRASRPRDLPSGSVLLVPPYVSDAELEAIERSGYLTRRSGQPVADTRADIVAAAEDELTLVASRLADELRRRHPEWFDASGRLLPHRYSRAALELTGGKRALSRGEVLSLRQDETASEGESRPLDGA